MSQVSVRGESGGTARTAPPDTVMLYVAAHSY